MDVNKLVDDLDRAVERDDAESAFGYDTQLAGIQAALQNSLNNMPGEHANTMGFYFRDWLMNLWDEFMFVLLIILAFNVESELLAIILGIVGLGGIFITLYGRRHYAVFMSTDIMRMRKEKMMSAHYRLQLQQITEVRTKHSGYIDEYLKEQVKDSTMASIFGPNTLWGTSNGPTPEPFTGAHDDESSKDKPE